MLTPSLRFILALLIVGGVSFQFVGVGAAQTTYSVKECLDNPSKCKKEDTTTKDIVTQQSQPSSDMSIMDYVKVIVSFAFVIGLLFFILKLVNKRNGNLTKGKLVRNLGGTSVGNNKSVQLIKVGKNVFIIGVGENITLLKEMESEVNLEENIQVEVDKKAIQQQATPPPFKQVFQQQISSMLTKRKKAIQDITEEGREKNE